MHAQVMDMLLAEGLDTNDTMFEQNIPRKEVLFEHTLEVRPPWLLTDAY